MLDLPLPRDAGPVQAAPGRERAVRRGPLVLAVVASGALAAPASGQSWRIRFDASAQRVAFRGVTADSVTAGQTVVGPTGGQVTSDGFAVNCTADGFCRFYRPGPILRGLPASAGTDLTLW